MNYIENIIYIYMLVYYKEKILKIKEVKYEYY